MKPTYFHRVYRYNRKFFFFISLFAGATLLCNLHNGKAQRDAFGPWYLGYLEKVLDRPVSQASVLVVQLHFDNNQHVVPDSTLLIATWKKQ
jgi:hypothetical protein